MNELSQTLSRLVRGWGPLVACALAGTAAGAAYAAVSPPSFTARAYVIVISGGREQGAVAGFAQAYGRVATQPELLRMAVSAPVTLSPPVRPPMPLEEVRRRVQVLVSPDAPLIEVSAGGGNAAGAAMLANAVAGKLVSYGNARSAETRVKLASFGEAAVPSSPSSPVPFLDVLVGAAAGVLVGGLAALGGASRVPAGRPRRANRRGDPPGAGAGGADESDDAGDVARFDPVEGRAGKRQEAAR